MVPLPGRQIIGVFVMSLITFLKIRSFLGSPKLEVGAPSVYRKGFTIVESL